MPCFIISSQFIIATFDLFIMQDRQRPQVITDHWDLRLDMKIVFSFYHIFNLNFFQNLLAPYCVSNKLKFIHIAFLGYISAIYPILLICLTWICVELHGRNFRPLVRLWRPFHRCFVRLRRGWNTKSDIIDAFTTFFFLTYSKILYQTLLLISSKPIKNVEPSGKSFLTYVSEVDQSVAYGGMYHISLAIPGIFISLIFNIIPPLFQIMPFKVSSKFYRPTYISGQSVCMLQEWFGWRTRYEELFWCLLFTRNYSIFYCGTVTRNELIPVYQSVVCYGNCFLCHHSSYNNS